MAYAALLSVAQVIERILPHQQDYYFFCCKEQMESLHQNVVCLQQFLEDYYEKRASFIDQLESRITDVCYQLEDMIESEISISGFTKSALMKLIPLWKMKRPDDRLLNVFHSCNEEIDSIMEEIVKMKEISKNKTVLERTTYCSRGAPGINETKVGLKKDLIQIMERATGHERRLQVIPIVGMGGIGKTTLARTVYEDPIIIQHFDVRFWETVSQEYNIQEILQGLIRLLLREGGIDEDEDEGLIVRVYKNLKGRRFLIVLDDIWHTEVWDGVKKALPNDNNGSRLILTTRLSDLAATLVDYSSPLHQMQFLNEDQSWDLLRKKLYGHECCPPEFERTGKIIARNCKGLPLAIVVIAGLLKSNKTRLDYWEEVARNISAAAAKHDDELFGILSLSYTYLPPQLKACFLHMGAFPEGEEIPARKLIMLWVAEGFIKPSASKSSEDVAEEYLEDLVRRNLVLVAKMGTNGKIKTPMMHDSMRELSIRKAQEWKFLHCRYNFQNIMEHERLMTLATENFISYPGDIYNTPVLSVIDFLATDDCLFLLSSIASSFRRVRVLGGVPITLGSTSALKHIFGLSNLRYLHVIVSTISLGIPGSKTNLKNHVIVSTKSLRIPRSITNLKNLETLIFSTGYDTHGIELILPSSIWIMRQLKHIFAIRNTTLPVPILSSQSNCVLDKLQSLSRVMNFRFTKSVIRRIPNLQKLKIEYPDESIDLWVHFGLNDLVDLHKLEELSIKFSGRNQLLAMNLAFPQKLKKLTLESTKFPWEKISIIGSLQNLQVLNLLRVSFIGEEWEPIEGEFLQLKYLKLSHLDTLEYWRAESTHFPCLETLIIGNCPNLVEVPASIGDIPTLQNLIVKYCSENVYQSMRRIKEEQESYGNDALQIVIESR